MHFRSPSTGVGAIPRFVTRRYPRSRRTRERLRGFLPSVRDSGWDGFFPREDGKDGEPARTPGITARTLDVHRKSLTRLRNGCSHHVHGCCQARPRRLLQVRLQGLPRLRGGAQEGCWRPRHPPGTHRRRGLRRPRAATKPRDATDAPRTIATCALTLRGDPRVVVTPSTSRTARGPASETRQSVPFQGPASRRKGYPDRATRPRATRGDARARVPTTRNTALRRRSSPRAIRGSPFGPDARPARVTRAPAFALREGFASTSG